jgi:hypothetical protein
MKPRYLKTAFITTAVVAVIAIIAAVVLVQLKNTKETDAVIRTTYEIKTPPLSLTKAEDIYDMNAQNEIWADIEAYKESKDYTFEDALIIDNPFQTNSQSMYIYFNTEEPASMEYTVHVENTDIPDFTRACFNSGEDNLTTEHEYQILGVIPEADNVITLKLTYSSGKTEARSFIYQAPALIGSGDLILTYTDGETSEALEDGLYTVFAGDSFFYYYDNDGNLRSEFPILNYRALRLIFKDDKMYYSAGFSTFVEMNSLGRLTSIYDLGTYNVHHDYTFDDSGNILLLATDTQSPQEEDRILYLKPDTGEISQILDLTDMFPDYYTNCKPNKDGKLDWMHINTIQWLGNDTLLLSSRETSSILKINNIFSTPSLEYMLGTESFWQDSPYTSYLYEKAGDFKSQLGQHTITYVEDSSLEEGQYYLYMFDNNIGISSTRPDYNWQEHFDDIGSAGSAESDETSMFYKYLVDENSKNYSLVESFEVPYSGYQSSAQEIGSNTVISPSNPKVFQEYDKDNNLIRSFETGNSKQSYRTYKYTFENFYFK